MEDETAGVSKTSIPTLKRRPTATPEIEPDPDAATETLSTPPKKFRGRNEKNEVASVKVTTEFDETRKLVVDTPRIARDIFQDLKARHPNDVALPILERNLRTIESLSAPFQNLIFNIAVVGENGSTNLQFANWLCGNDEGAFRNDRPKTTFITCFRRSVIHSIVVKLCTSEEFPNRVQLEQDQAVPLREMVMTHLVSIGFIHNPDQTGLLELSTPSDRQEEYFQLVLQHLEKLSEGQRKAIDWIQVQGPFTLPSDVPVFVFPGWSAQQDHHKGVAQELGFLAICLTSGFPDVDQLIPRGILTRHGMATPTITAVHASFFGDFEPTPNFFSLMANGQQEKLVTDSVDQLLHRFDQVPGMVDSLSEEDTRLLQKIQLLLHKRKGHEVERQQVWRDLAGDPAFPRAGRLISALVELSWIREGLAAAIDRHNYCTGNNAQFRQEVINKVVFHWPEDMNVLKLLDNIRLMALGNDVSRILDSANSFATKLDSLSNPHLPYRIGNTALAISTQWEKVMALLVMTTEWHLTTATRDIVLDIGSDTWIDTVHSTVFNDFTDRVLWGMEWALRGSQQQFSASVTSLFPWVDRDEVMVPLGPEPNILPEWFAFIDIALEWIEKAKEMRESTLKPFTTPVALKNSRPEAPERFVGTGLVIPIAEIMATDAILDINSLRNTWAKFLGKTLNDLVSVASTLARSSITPLDNSPLRLRINHLQRLRSRMDHGVGGPRLELKGHSSPFPGFSDQVVFQVIQSTEFLAQSKEVGDLLSFLQLIFKGNKLKLPESYDTGSRKPLQCIPDICTCQTRCRNQSQAVLEPHDRDTRDHCGADTRRLGRFRIKVRFLPHSRDSSLQNSSLCVLRRGSKHQGLHPMVQVLMDQPQVLQDPLIPQSSSGSPEDVHHVRIIVCVPSLQDQALQAASTDEDCFVVVLPFDNGSTSLLGLELVRQLFLKFDILYFWHLPPKFRFIEEYQPSQFRFDPVATPWALMTAQLLFPKIESLVMDLIDEKLKPIISKLVKARDNWPSRGSLSLILAQLEQRCTTASEGEGYRPIDLLRMLLEDKSARDLMDRILADMNPDNRKGLIFREHLTNVLRMWLRSSALVIPPPCEVIHRHLYREDSDNGLWNTRDLHSATNSPVLFNMSSIQNVPFFDHDSKGKDIRHYYVETLWARGRRLVVFGRLSARGVMLKPTACVR